MDDFTLLNVMVSNTSPRATVCSKLPVTTTCMLSLLEETTVLDEDFSELEETTLEDETSLEEDSTLELLFAEELLAMLEEDFSELEDTSELEEATLDEDFTLLDDATLDEDASELEERTTVIVPVAEVFSSLPVTSTVKT